MKRPADPIAAATHPDPYPYYERLRAERPFAFDASLGMWVAADFAAATAVLTDPHCRVRPPDALVPPALRGSRAGDIFGRLARMNDGERHAAARRMVAQALATVDERRVDEISRRGAAVLLGERFGRGPDTPRSDGAFALPVFVIGGLLGIPDDALVQTTAWVDDFTRCLAPTSSPEQIERGKAAADRLHALVQPLAARETRAPGSLMRVLAREARRAGIDDRETVVANAIGLLAQAYEATAGAIGATLLAFGRCPALRRQIDAAPNLLGPAIAETLRHDPSIQNTRRVVAEDCRIAGRDLRAGDVILVVLAAANRDPAANPDPNRFDLDRRLRRMLTFGAGAHACPGAALAMTIAHAGVERALASRLPIPSNGKTVYRPSANARVPLLPAGRTP